MGDGSSANFIAALKAIQNAVLGCTYNMPAPTDGGVVDPNQVAIEYLPNGQEPGQSLTKVANAAACAPGSWYYDTSTSPWTIQLCPALCTVVQADSHAKVSILLGCQGS